MKESPCLIRQHEVRSIPGGWTLTHPELPGQSFTGSSPERAIASLELSLELNRKTISRAALWDHANRVWGNVVVKAGQADRWMGTQEMLAEPENAEPGARARRTFARTLLTPKETGPPLWGTLHLVPLVFTEERWLAHVRLMTALIAPNGNHDAGCERCSNHWRRFTAANPPEAVRNAAAAADWSLRAHNQASQNAGHRQWTWEEAARQWGWPPEWMPAQSPPPLQ